VTFNIAGFGATQLVATPQTFQALSVAGAAPQPPAPPYGNPNTQLVPVARTTAPVLPANLTLAAAPAFAALLHVTGQSLVLGVGHPAATAGQSNSTAFVGATDPAITTLTTGEIPATLGAQANTAPAGPISFTVTAGVPGAITDVGSLPPLTDGSQAPVAAVSGAASAVAKIVATVKQLAAGAVYPASIFSFHA
jgi:hypothetical protein